LISTLTALLSIFSTYWGLSYGGGAKNQLALTPAIIVYSAALMLLATLSLSAMGMALSVFAKSVREAESYLSPVFFLVFVPLYVVWYLPPSTLSQLSVLPIVGYAMILRDIILGTSSSVEILAGLSTNSAFTVVMFVAAVRALQSEKAVLRGT